MYLGELSVLINKKMGTTEKLTAAKELLAKIFVDATSCSAESGIKYKYVSKAVDVSDTEKGWVFQIILKEPAYPERILQEFKYLRPAGIDAKSMEYDVIVSVMSQVTQTASLTWNHLGILLKGDVELQGTAKEVTKNGN
jgi:hypothetical protein